MFPHILRNVALLSTQCQRVACARRSVNCTVRLVHVERSSHVHLYSTLTVKGLRVHRVIKIFEQLIFGSRSSKQFSNLAFEDLDEDLPEVTHRDEIFMETKFKELEGD